MIIQMMQTNHYTNHDDDESSICQIIDYQYGVTIYYRNQVVQETEVDLSTIAEDLKKIDSINDIFYQRLCNRLSDEAMEMLNLRVQKA